MLNARSYKMETIDTEEYQMGEGGRRKKKKKNPIWYYAPYLNDGIICTPNSSIMQYTHVTNMHMYSLI